MIGTSAIDHGQLCLSSSISAPSRWARLRDRADRRHAQIERRPVVQHEERAQGVARLADGEDLVLGVARHDQVRGVDPDRVGAGVAERRLAALDRRDERLADPVEQREGHVEVLGEHHVGQLVERAVDVRVARIPAPLRHVDPAAEPEGELRPARHRP